MNSEDASEVKNNSKPGNSRLRQAREQRAWTQSEVAERIRTTRINVGRWENGLTFPSPYYRQKLGELFGKSLQELGLIPEGVEERNQPHPERMGICLNALDHVPAQTVSVDEVVDRPERDIRIVTDPGRA